MFLGFDASQFFILFKEKSLPIPRDENGPKLLYEVTFKKRIRPNQIKAIIFTTGIEHDILEILNDAEESSIINKLNNLCKIYEKEFYIFDQKNYKNYTLKK